MRSLRVTAAALIALTMPLMTFMPAQAFAQSSSNASLQALLAELSALEQQINTLSGSSSTAATPNATPAPSAPIPTTTGCPDLSRTLSLGSSGVDVVGLQTFLGQQGLFTALTTGYYGALTASAVATWQEQNGVVSGGDAMTTGLGVVGPKTRAAMDAGCMDPGAAAPSTAALHPCAAVLPPATECVTSWKPVSDPNGCTLYFQCSIPLPGTVSNTSSASATSSAPAGQCPVVQKPTCSGTITPYQYNANNCVTAYQCSL